MIQGRVRAEALDVAPSIILWPDGQGSFVLSQRNPNGYKPPIGKSLQL
jgi:hypothetical protein